MSIRPLEVDILGTVTFIYCGYRRKADDGRIHLMIVIYRLSLPLVYMEK